MRHCSVSSGWLIGARASLFEGQVRVQPTGKVSVYRLTFTWPGHETTFAQVVADKLGISMDDVEAFMVIQKGWFCMGTYGSGSIAVGGTAIMLSINKIIEKERSPAHLLEAMLTILSLKTANSR
jgi:carbon-monoxide dehydrogenase large subunit